jgi:hypothetical protein
VNQLGQLSSKPVATAVDRGGQRLRKLRKLSRVCNWAIAALGIATFVSNHTKVELPAPQRILQSVKEEPVQRLTGGPEFTLEHHGTEYTVQPVAEYEISGLVVTHNNIHAFDDIYHDGDSVDIKDICVIWGDNVSSSIFQRVAFYSEPWSCHFYASNSADFEEFRPDQVSNNHLLAEDERVQAIINSVSIGDQISLRGRLINYSPVENPSWIRKSSTTRLDTGNGACEVMLVEQARILRRANTLWQLISMVSGFALALALVLKAAAFITVGVIESDSLLC